MSKRFVRYIRLVIKAKDAPTASELTEYIIEDIAGRDFGKQEVVAVQQVYVPEKKIRV